MAWTYVRAAIGTNDVSCALSLDGSTVYACDRSAGVVRSLGFPALSGGGTTVYTEPSGYDLNSVTDTPDGPLVVVCSHADGSGEVRDFSDNIIHTTSAAVSTDGVRAVWSPVDSRLYVLRRPTGGADHVLYSMDNDGTSVVTEFDSVAATSVNSPRHGLMVTEDGGVWFCSITFTTRNATRIDPPTDSEQLAAGGTTRGGLAHVPGNPDAVYQTVSTTSTNRIDFDGGAMTTVAEATAFDGYELIQSSASSDFTKGVAFGVDTTPNPDVFAWFMFEEDVANPWTVGRVRWGSNPHAWH